jgi:hypothetical protein
VTTQSHCRWHSTKPSVRTFIYHLYLRVSQKGGNTRGSATSHAVRAALTGRPKLKDTLQSIDRLRGPAREEALQACLGVSRSDVTSSVGGGIRVGEEEKEAMGELAEAIEAAVRGNREDALGLDWDQN